MSALALGLGLTAVGLLLHVIRWWVARPTQALRGLVLSLLTGIFGALAAALLLAWILPGFAVLLPAAPLGVAQAVVLAVALAAAYVMAYPVLAAETPTEAIVRAVSAAGSEGLASEQLFQRLDDAALVAPLIETLRPDGLALESEGRLLLTPRGRWLARSAGLWRALLGADKGG